MDKSKQPGIRFDGIILAEENFWRDYSIPKDSKIDLHFSAENHIEGKKATVEVTSYLRLIYEEKEVLKLESKFVGFFSEIEGQENMNIEDYIKNNSVALIFPYIREHIHMITAKSGIKPIMLPPINLRAMLNTEKDKPVVK
ncbi:MAG TPA: hypothetical protein GXX53_04360 [Tissierellia bacterium]|nr:hypothetical protein [Tissierellia bacterium]